MAAHDTIKMGTASDESETPPKAEVLNEETFHYKLLLDGEIRVIHFAPLTDGDNIRGSLQNKSVEKAIEDEYSALSYTWGNDIQTLYTIILDNQKFYIRENLFVALKTLLQEDKSKDFWIDAICIDQNNKEEKAKQLPLMSRIYSKAQTVEIWLGPCLGDGELALTAISSGEIGNIATVEMIHALIPFLQRQWFQRLWVIQELVLAAPLAAYINCGSTRHPWELFSTGLSQILAPNFLMTISERFCGGETSTSEASTQRLSAIEIAILKNQISVVMGRWGVQIDKLCSLRTALSTRATSPDTEWKPTEAVGITLQKARYAEASQLADKVFGVCGLFADSARDELMRFFGEDIKKVYFAATSYILRHDTCPNLYHEFPTLPKSDKEDGVPSWTLDFSFTGSTYAEIAFQSLTKSNAPRTGADKLQLSLDGRELTVDACIVDDIKGIVHQEQIAKVPDTQDEWIQLFAKVFQNGKAMQLESFIWLMQEFSEAVNLITFIERANELHDQATSDWKGVETIPSILSVMMAGLSYYTRQSIPSGEELKRDVEILLGRKDNLIANQSTLGTWKVFAQALGLDESRAMSKIRYVAVPKLKVALPQALAPKWSNTRASYFSTNHGLCGVAMPGASVGDKVARIFCRTAYEIPFILRHEEANKYSMVCAANVSDNWTVLAEAQGTLEPQEIVLV